MILIIFIVLSVITCGFFTSILIDVMSQEEKARARYQYEQQRHRELCRRLSEEGPWQSEPKSNR